MNNIGDKIKITNVQNLKKEDLKILFENDFVCTIEDVDTYPTNEGTIDIVYTVEILGAPFTTNDFKQLTN